MDAGRNAPVRVQLKLKTDFGQVAHAVLQVSFYLVAGSTLNLNLIPIIEILLEKTISIF